ncbi:MAG: hypothetical protein V3T56_06000 [Gemmatimonadales bacterium]
MQHGPSIQFLGAAGTVTGSKHLLRANGSAVLSWPKTGSGPL